MSMYISSTFRYEYEVLQADIPFLPNYARDAPVKVERKTIWVLRLSADRRSCLLATVASVKMLVAVVVNWERASLTLLIVNSAKPGSKDWY